jgi:hypothetical protein
MSESLPPRRVFLALPHYGPIEREHANAVTDAERTGYVYSSARSSSLLARGFNALWCEALNSRAKAGWTHFVMLHSDIAPEAGWLPKLLDEMDAARCDVLSVVTPIKSTERNSSTAVLSADATEAEILSLETIRQLPQTFSRDQFAGRPLLVNTGCMAVRFTEAWIENCWFEIRDTIERNPDTGLFEPRGMSEDWLFSQLAQHLGRRVCATSKIGLAHFGRLAWQTCPQTRDTPQDYHPMPWTPNAEPQPQPQPQPDNEAAA